MEIFCQDYVSSGTDQLLEIDDFEERSTEFKELARPLQFAASDPDVRKVMTIEDEMSIHFQNVKYVTDENEALHILVEESRQQLQESRQQLATSIKMLSELGVSPEQIAEKLKISVETVNKTLKL